ncbi:MAG TPA: hypothetical protein VFU49_21805 [Ktedonobacteraceae bacterium]|nr:hypothetical protein [Ktedonobacteraceae bacterium]
MMQFFAYSIIPMVERVTVPVSLCIFSFSFLLRQAPDRLPFCMEGVCRRASILSLLPIVPRHRVLPVQQCHARE